MTAPCTCRAPPIVDITDAYEARHGRHEATSTPISLTCRQDLLGNLSRVGWSQVSMDMSRISDDTPLKLDLWKNPKRTIQGMFDPANKNSIPRNVTYRTAESGAARDNTVEPKQSWEIRRCRHSDNNQQQQIQNKHDKNGTNHQLEQWTEALHSIATTIRWALELPPNVLMQDSTEGDCAQNSNSSQENQCNIDLLRVFYYDQISDNQNQRVLGSSPHTDWGTFTVVWQDDVGGLQTFCHACQTWNDVAPVVVQQPAANGNTVNFVIHVGDATSLAMGHAINIQTNNQQTTKIDQPQKWPSPKHRVVSPCSDTRASLVYFVYPPPHMSLATMTEQLVAWWSTTNNASAYDIPYDCYYLLHNQSAGNDDHHKSSPEQVYKSIMDRPMQQVFAEKWNQVQRTASS